MNSISSMHRGGLGFSNAEIIPEEICFHPAIVFLAELGTAQKSCGSAVGCFWTRLTEASEPEVMPS